MFLRGVIIGLFIVSSAGGWAQGLAPEVELMAGLQSGQIWAQFWGGGDTGVNGLIGRSADGPSGVVISPGTQFWAQTSGSQGQTSLGTSRVSLGSGGSGQQQRYRQPRHNNSSNNFLP